MNLNCPSCGSSRTKGLNLVYTGGTTEVRYNSFYIGTRRNFGYIPTFGRRQTMKARLAAPPLQRQWTCIGWFFLMGLAILIALIKLAASEDAVPGTALLITWLVSSTALAVWDHNRALRYNETIWPDLWDRWNRSYVCERCGCIFELEGDTAGGSVGGDDGNLFFPDISRLRAKAKSDVNATRTLAERYELGVGIAQDRVRAARLYLEAARTRDAEARTDLEVLYGRADEDELRQIADNGDADAETALGDRIYYYELDPTPEQMQECFRWYQVAADHGSAKGMAMLAHLYYIGNGVDEDIEQARHWAEMALARGEKSAIETLAATNGPRGRQTKHLDA